MFTYIDATFLIFLVICILVGVWRGFFRSLTKFCGLTVKLIISFILCKPISKWISSATQIDEHMFDTYSTWASGLSESFNTNLKTIPNESLNDFIKNSLGDSGVPKLFRGLLSSALNITPDSISDIESITLAELVGEALKNLILIVACFVIIFLLLYLIIFIINKIEKHILRSTRIVSKIDRTFGGIVGVLRSFMYVFGICLILSIFRNVIIFQEFYNTIDSSLIAGPISRFMFNIIDKNIDFNRMIFDWIQNRL
ncbi:MAG: CvpA family protein [Clostridia bacterium]|nr:CvpA family protein [Clostridia bacterium]